MAAAEEARGAEAKGPRRRRRSARLDGDDEGGARASDGDEGAVRAEERGEATDGGGRRSRKAVTEKAAADIEWNGGTACKKKDSLPLPPLIEDVLTPRPRPFLGRALLPLREREARS